MTTPRKLTNNNDTKIKIMLTLETTVKTVKGQTYYKSKEIENWIGVNTLFSVTVAICMLIFTTTSGLAETLFEGALKSVSITDSAQTNSPPTAIFTYTQEGDIITFDASGSTDSDGSIIQYKWSFGNGNIADGKTAIYTNPNISNLQVTLTVFDNNNGIAINQETIPASVNDSSANNIADDFSNDTSSDYTLLTGGLNITNGAAHSTGNWTTTYAIHSNKLASSNHFIEADVYYDGSSATAGLILRVDKLQKTGYTISFESKRIVLKSYSNGTEQWLAHYDGNYGAGIYHIKAEILGNIIRIYNSEQLVLEKIDSTFVNGTYAGFKIYPYGKAEMVNIDNLTGN